MKVVISEKQLANLIGKHKELGEASTTDSSSSSTSSSASSSTASATAAGPGGSTNGQSAGPEGKGAMDFPAYPPEVDKADDLVKRGVANPVDYTKKHEDYPEANPVRSRANPIKGM